MDPDDPHILGPDLLPTPFTADEIRQGCPLGRVIRLLVEHEDEVPSLRMNTFVAADADGATIESQRLSLNGRPMDNATASTTTWRQLQAHAAFPADRTTVRSEELDLGFGLLDCLRYDVVDGATTNTFWFARSAPGQPVRYRTVEDGRVTSTVTMIADEMPQPD
ncbi:MAG: hypothetical protein L0221_11075 [Chloroflexi bacterium]|nr:hypothetical protein [Chloroflexota bacterium]